MKRDEIMGGKYFNADDVRAKDLVLTIAEVTLEEFKAEDGYKQKKTVIAFRGTEKKLVCGKNKMGLLFELFGEDSDTDDWEGQRLRLYLGKTTFAGKRVDCVDVGPPKPLKTARPPVAINNVEFTEEGDEEPEFLNKSY